LLKALPLPYLSPRSSAFIANGRGNQQAFCIRRDPSGNPFWIRSNKNSLELDSLCVYKCNGRYETGII
jgi:hypothetical protein